MGFLSNRRVLIGAVFMIVGTVLLLPAVLPNIGELFTYALLPGAALLIYGTWLVGTSESGPAV
ncbi:hypothetical protein [Haloquadratum walsbyi]|jgi:hypothetical protein|uniref:Uncharacterized protein n=2 Tax=Haloquadratum walsbyi TaxID=293091 RepID=Q18GP7_HALWD|nr:hypothetical protein [Haloquadratum walsbyi]CAJ52850.2 uncharacterized protein HQ_2742A [Haloquadratum walsbyi DSM 16790]CCC40881.1 uncharacterized protein Hqrw_3094 [Haloquadratum walsbyi C23]